MIYLKIKRLFDFAIASILLIVLSPIFLVVAILIKVDSPGPVFYTGQRTGINGVMFRMFKFRSMVLDADRLGGPSTAFNDVRLTTIGGFLRKHKIDELPQLINIFKGEMSLVGPRPQVKFYTDKYSLEEKKILSMKPGITDLASLYFSDMDSILGSHDVDTFYNQNIEPIKNQLRLRYVRDITFSLDIKILIETVLYILKIPSYFDLKLDSDR